MLASLGSHFGLGEATVKDEEVNQHAGRLGQGETGLRGVLGITSRAPWLSPTERKSLEAFKELSIF